MELYSTHLDGISFLEPIGVGLETSLTVKVAWVFFQVTVFENIIKCLIFIAIKTKSRFWHFPLIFVLLKLICLVTLFDRELQVFKNSPKWTIFGIFN